MTSMRSDSPFIVRAVRIRAHEDAEDIVAEARAESARLRAEAERIVDAAREEATELLAEARRRGIDEGATEAAAVVARAAKAMEQLLAERRDELRDVAFAVAHRVLGAMPQDEVALRLAQQAIDEHGRDVRLAMKVSPDVAEPLRAALAESAHGNRVTVAEDAALAPGEMTLLHPRGRTQIGLLAQFRAMMATVGPQGEEDER